jgi:hypothetical protein
VVAGLEDLEVVMRLPVVLLVLVLWMASAGAGWLTAPGRAAASSVAGDASSRDKRLPDRPRRPRPRILKLRALDTELDVDQIEKLAAPERARFGAKKWTEMLDRQAEMIGRGFGPVVALDDYFVGWQAIAAETAPYSAEQFAEGLKGELCSRPQSERDLLQQNAPAVGAPSCAGDKPIQ